MQIEKAAENLMDAADANRQAGRQAVDVPLAMRFMDSGRARVAAVRTTALLLPLALAE